MRSPRRECWQRCVAKWRMFWIVVVLSLVADQVTKIWARAVAAGRRPRHAATACAWSPTTSSRASAAARRSTVIDGYWDWRLSMNPGSAFGLFGGSARASRACSCRSSASRAVIGMVFMLKKSRADQRILHWALALVAGGAVGNLIDRIYFGVVTDFVLWKYKTHEWPVFNVADVVLVVGVGLMFIDIQKENKREKAREEGKAQAEAQGRGLVKDTRNSAAGIRERRRRSWCMPRSARCGAVLAIFVCTTGFDQGERRSVGARSSPTRRIARSRSSRASGTGSSRRTRAWRSRRSRRGGGRSSCRSSRRSRSSGSGRGARTRPGERLKLARPRDDRRRRARQPDRSGARRCGHRLRALACPRPLMADLQRGGCGAAPGRGS